MSARTYKNFETRDRGFRLYSLSSSQSILFNMFTTIIRYADKGDINKSINLTEIEGIVIIDENDREGNEQFKGLNKSCFEDYDISKESRKHGSKDAWGFLLTIPVSRSKFVTSDDITQRYLVIEHYFSDDLLKKFNKYGQNILGAEVFKIIGDKDSFASNVESFDISEFENFRQLFEKLNNLLQSIQNSYK
ncbi:hypothetical protein [uncultured Nostoc sp.]|uniref:hypothetical protein n=1 Tax=uncultured Nostoc sp. TaxID=340711 RepID=UPI0026169E7F|nr:hypothetical protein [uncultured Nostoc sp.]